ncbi:MAG: 2-oxo acid dehydrogenase subunit E2 [Bacteroidetes bacterium]|nr:MAG: 2-oxo acid dehydrogenase subunit E2 [Bacteroidota bacterium]
MTEFELIMPKMGESIAEATIINWLKNEGDKIEADESVLEIATDKVDSEVPSPKGGVLLKKLYNVNDVVEVGKPIAIIGLEGAGAQPAAPASQPAEKPVETAPTPVASVQNTITQARETVAPVAGGARFYSPLVLNIARSENISMAELEGLPGTGSEGRVTKKDILAYVQQRQNGVAPAATPAAQPEVKVVEKPAAQVSQPKITAPAVSLNAGDEIIEMDRMRKLIADHMVMSKHTSPHVTSFVEADVTNMVRWREKMKDVFQKRDGEKLTFTPMLIEAIAKAIKDFPMINISVDGTNLIRRKAINIGMAAALPSGNLIVPVIKNADTKNLLGLVKDVNDLANRARNNKLTPDEIQGGTYTLTNVGTFGNVMGTPIINQPQVAIMAAGAIRKKPAVVETEYGDVIAIRHMMYLSHSYDHRVVDGALGGMFVRRVADYLEQWDVNREM